MSDVSALHEQVLYSQVRVKVGQSGGSGTIIYSEATDSGTHNTYALTCHHVIDDAVTVKDEWDPKVGRQRRREIRQLVTVEFFDWSNVAHGNRPLNYSADAEIMAYDKDHDMAILRLRTIKRAPYVATLMRDGDQKTLTIGSRVVAVGSALLHDPILTEGIITHFGDEIDGKLYWMSNAQIIFGNSGGAVFHAGQMYSFIGIPSRVAVSGWGNTPVTHLGYFSPISRVHEFFREQTFDFLTPGSGKTEADCEVERRSIRDREERKLLVEAPTTPSGVGVG